MWSFVENCLRRYPDAKIISDTRILFYREILDEVVIHGENLKSALKPRAKCGILCDSGLNAAMAILACWYADMIAIPLSKNYGQDHCNKIISLTDPDILLTDNDDCLYRYTYNLKQKVFFGKSDDINPESELNDIALIMCTSGTTGNPKGAMITKDGLQKNVKAIAQYFDINDTDTILIARPLYHCAVLTGEFLISLIKGVNIAFLDEAYNPVNVISYMIKCNATTICGTPTLLNHISRLIKLNCRENSIKKMAISGECLSSGIAKNIRDVFPNADIYSIYGLTEASPRVSYLPPADFDKYSESVGIPIDGVKVKIIDVQTGGDLPANSRGLVMISSPSLMKGYYNDQSLTQKTIVNGWLNTHDIGYKDENGYLYILGRADDMIIKAGMNIYPREIENAINKLPEISECLAYGRKGSLGEDIIIDIVLSKESIQITKKDLMVKFKQVLSPYLMPSNINIVDTIPRNASGKLIRSKRFHDE
ncbi:MAG: acyl--CoA ligase [Clostridiales bacterium]|nr:acyl--CoA ligase [Clostridiales bacterium]